MTMISICHTPESISTLYMLYMINQDESIFVSWYDKLDNSNKLNFINLLNNYSGCNNDR